VYTPDLQWRGSFPNLDQDIRWPLQLLISLSLVSGKNVSTVPYETSCKLYRRIPVTLWSYCTLIFTTWWPTYETKKSIGTTIHIILKCRWNVSSCLQHILINANAKINFSDTLYKCPYLWGGRGERKPHFFFFFFFFSRQRDEIWIISWIQWPHN